ncbi:MAG: hypothetical protein L6416_02705, partial [Candidatus Omnitrophica bacterium]|nr:hypothetical protein [Candidatus Omnitrophota bacterium]
KGGKKYSWLKYADVINREWLKGRKGARAYEMFMEEEDDKELEELYRARNLGSILGDNDYKDDISEKYIHSKRYYDKEIPEHRRIKQGKKMEQIERLVCKEYKLDNKDLRKAVRGRENEARKVAIRLIREKTGVACRQIAQRYGVGNERSISEYCRRIRQKADRDKKFLKRYRLLESSLQVET